MEASSIAFKKDVTDMIEPSVIPKCDEDFQASLGEADSEKNEKKGTSSSLSTFVTNQIHYKEHFHSDLKKPDYNLLFIQKKLKQTLEKTHARNKYKKTYGCYEACFKFNTGWHRLFRASSESDIDKFGAGTALYFRFVKYVACFFFIFVLLSAPSLYFAIKASGNFGINGLEDYKDVLYLTTIGSIGRGASHCVQGKIDDFVTFSCESGKLGSGIQYGRVLEAQAQACDSLSMFSWDVQCNNQNQQALREVYEACEGLSSCKIQIKREFFDFSKSGCGKFDPQKNSKAEFYFRALCSDVELELPGGSSIKKKAIGHIIASLDAIICLIYVFLPALLKGLERKTVYNIEGNIDSVDSYSIKVSNIPEMAKQELRRELWKHFSQGKNINIF